jgi:hypothetical protein
MVACVLDVCVSFKGSITSWWRTPLRNAAVGGTANSKHLRGLAVDVVWDGPLPDLGELRARCLSFGVRVLREATHDHLELI